MMLLSRNCSPLSAQFSFFSMVSKPPRFTLIYDGECALCRRSVEWVRVRDQSGAIEFLPYQDRRFAERFPWIPEEDVRNAMQLVGAGGSRSQGAEAVEEVLGLLPRWRRLTPLFGLPGVRTLARIVYAGVARNRRRLGCAEHCGVGDARVRVRDRSAAMVPETEETR